MNKIDKYQQRIESSIHNRTVVTRSDLVRACMGEFGVLFEVRTLETVLETMVKEKKIKQFRVTNNMLSIFCYISSDSVIVQD